MIFCMGTDGFVEILDFGYPQNSEIDTLKMYITTESIKSEMAVVRISFMQLMKAELRLLCRGKTRQRSRYKRQERHHGGDQMSSTGRMRLLWM